MSKIGPFVVTVISGFVLLALVSVVVGSNQTAGLLKSVGDTLSSLITKASGA